MSASNDPVNVLRQKYRGLRHLLAANTEVLEMMADIEADPLPLVPGELGFRENLTALIERTLLLIQDLVLLSGGRFQELFGIHGKIEADIRHYLRTNSVQGPRRLLFQLGDVDAKMTREVGGKAANLGEISKFLNAEVPPGFVITTAAYLLFLEANGLNNPIRKLLRDISLISDRHLFRSRTEEIRRLFQNGSMPVSIADAIVEGVRGSVPEAALWAVRSSAVGEDGRLSYAGQFETLLNVTSDKLTDAYLSVLGSRYSDRAMQYCIEAGCARVDSPMAVLFIPMVRARTAGVLYSRDPADEGADRMLITAVQGLAEEMTRGYAGAEVFLASRTEPGLILEQRAVADTVSEGGRAVSLSSAEVKALVESALKVEKHFGRPQDLEWAIDQQGRLSVLQARELRLAEGRLQPTPSGQLPVPLLSGGTTIYPGRAAGNAWVLRAGRNLDSIPKEALMIVDQPSPELALVLPKIAGLIATYGNPAAHAATLMREAGVPSVFGMANATGVIRDGQSLSLDAGKRAVYDGIHWSSIRDRVRLKAHSPTPPKPGGFLSERILALNLVDPRAASFRPKSCRTIHDIVRFVHEKAVETIFDLGDTQAQKSAKAAVLLKTDVPLNLRVLNLGGGVAPNVRDETAIEPSDITSLPFRALWRGITSPGIKWTGRDHIDAAGFASVIANSLSQTGDPARGLGARNYLMVAVDYVCLNARLAYHFTMVDAMVGEVSENNYVNLRFRGGGAGSERRSLRAQFLAQVLLRSNFGVNRQGDLVTAWLRRYPLTASEEGLSMIGKLMGCARQLDMLLRNSDDVRTYADRFLQGDYHFFT